ncbi:MAG: BON domain-containing protein [Caulobacterales bacterium]|nr:BON domain-containing protein [Caulobacterales bacterium]
MPREDWRDLEAERRWRLREPERYPDRETYADRGTYDDRGRDRYGERDLEDYGQADYSTLYGYDPRTRTGYPLFDDGRSPGYGPGPAERPGQWDYGPERRRARRDGPSDRVLWAVIMERLDHERRLDTRNVDVDVRDGEVTLNGTVRHKADKRRIEDIADIEGVRNVQNNLRVRASRWTFL